DRNGTVHSYSYDVLGRLTKDTVTTLGAGVDGAVRRLEISCDTQGNAAVLTSYDAPSGGNPVNQVLRQYNGLAQLTAEFQSHSGVVNPNTTLAVRYGYSSSGNTSRPTSMTYPNGRQLNYNYAAGTDGAVSRLSSLSDGSGVLEGYTYLGLGSVVERLHPL